MYKNAKYKGKKVPQIVEDSYYYMIRFCRSKASRLVGQRKQIKIRKRLNLVRI